MAYTITPNSNSLATEAGLYQRVSNEGAPALSLLGKAALDAIECGRAEPLEGLAIAGLFYRMAAEREQPACGAAHVEHAEVMLRRERIDREAGNEDLAAIAGAFAIRALGRAADLGNEAASIRLTEIAEGLLHGAHAIAQAWEETAGATEQAGYDAVLRKAAEGDAAALIGVITEAIADEAAGAMEPVEMLAICEQVGRLGTAAGHRELAVRLSGALLCRAKVERSDGNADLAISKEVEGIGILALAAQAHHPGAAEMLVSVMPLIQALSLADAVRRDPTILAMLPVQGAS